jgi:Uma2 family endonuclease
MTPQEYLRLTDKPYFEYRDGVVTQKPWPDMQHGLIQSALCLQLWKLGVQPYPSLTLPVSPTKFLIPDVAAATGRIADPYPTEPVLLCCEVLSPGELLGATFAKCEEYHDWGVRYCWIVDPTKRTAWEYHQGAEPTKAVSMVQAGKLAVSVSDLFAELDD